MAVALSAPGKAAPDTAPRPRATRAIFAAALLAVAAAGITFAFHAESSRHAHQRQAVMLVSVLAELLAEQAGRVFDVAQVIAGRARAIVGDGTWDGIRQKQPAQRELAREVRESGYVAAIWLFDQDGIARLSSRGFPSPPASAADREYFRLHQRDRDAGTLLSPVLRGHVADDSIMVVSQRIEDAGGNFRGIVAVALDPGHFRRLYEQIRVTYPVTVDLVRDDGAVLIRSSEPDLFGPVSGSTRIVRPPPAERFDAGVRPAEDPATGAALFQGFKRVRGFPAYAAVSVADADIRARWRREMLFQAALSGLGLLAILSALAAVRHFAGREAQALVALSAENAALDRRVRDRSRAIERRIVEVKHRVKNSLQLAASLLQLQRGRLVDEALRAPLGVAQARIQAVARVHQQLHQGKDFDLIELGDYLATVARDAVAAVAAPDRAVALTTDIAPMPARLDVAMPLGLIAAEAVANAIRHAAPGRPVAIAVTLARTGHGARLAIRDDGGGMAPGTEAGGAPPGLGMQLLRGLAGQVGGELEICSEAGGVRVRVDVPGPVGARNGAGAAG